MWVATAIGAQAAAPQTLAGAASPRAVQQQRVDSRLDAIQREADVLVAQEHSLLERLQELETEQASRQEELTRAEQEVSRIDAALESLNAEITTLEVRLERERPILEQRLVALYKQGPLRETRLLLDLTRARDVARTSRLVQALTRAEHRRFAAYEADRTTLMHKGQALAERSVEAAAARTVAAEAQSALEHAIARQSAAIAAIDSRRDLTARLARELSNARVQLNRMVAGVESSVLPPLPLEAFRGSLSWPAPGAVAQRFPKPREGSTMPLRQGIVIAAAGGTSVRAVHEGRVAYAAPFAGLGMLVIVDHGGQDFSLYGHLGPVTVSKGDRVEEGSLIGRSGLGSRGVPELYFELRVDGSPVDPVEWLSRAQP